jgi:hypothetical protein
MLVFKRHRYYYHSCSREISYFMLEWSIQKALVLSQLFKRDRLLHARMKYSKGIGIIAAVQEGWYFMLELSIQKALVLSQLFKRDKLLHA